MGKLFETYMHEQPEILKKIIDTRVDIARPLLEFCEEAPKRFFLIGSGSSYNAAYAVAPLIGEITGAEVTVLTPTMMAVYGITEGLIIALSQSGTSTNTLNAIRTLQKEGRRVLLVTAEPDSPAGIQADSCLIVPCGAERVGPKTKGVTATMMTLLIGMHAVAVRFRLVPNRVLSVFEQQIERVVGDLEPAIRSACVFFDQHKANLSKAPYIMLCSDTSVIGASLECALKLLETCWLPVFAYDVEEFMHGVHYADGPGTTLFFLISPHEGESERMMRIADFSQAHGADVYRFGTSGDFEGILLISDCCNLSRPFCLIVFFQALCALLSVDKGIECDVPRYPDFGKLMGTKDT